MKQKEKKMSKKSMKITSSTIMYIAASVVALIGIALLIDNIMLYKNNVAQYVAQGFPVDLIIKQLVPAQLLPGIFEPVGVYGGIALVLFSAGAINKKAAECLTLLTKGEVDNIVAEENILADNGVNVDNTETTEPAENFEEINEATDNSK